MVQADAVGAAQFKRQAGVLDRVGLLDRYQDHSPREPNCRPPSALMLAVLSGHAEIMRRLARAGAGRGPRGS